MRLEQFLDLVVDVLGGEAEFLVEDLERGREAERTKSLNSTVLANE